MIYIAGPTVKSLEEQRLLTAVYKAVEKALERRGYAASLPVRTDELSGLSPPDFYSAIETKVSESDGIITILAPGDQSSPVEAAVAALRNKKQTVLAMSGKQAPRLIEGLPGVAKVVPLDKGKLNERVELAVAALVAALRPRPLKPPRRSQGRRTVRTRRGSL